MDKEKIIKNSRLALTLLGFPRLFKHPTMLKNAKQEYDNIKADGGEIDQLYDSLPYVLTNDDKSNLRHPYANAKFIRKYPENFVKDLGNYKEVNDILEGKGWDDTKSDLINNQYGLELGKQYINAPNEIIFTNLLEHFGLPVMPLNGILHGYETFTEGIDRR